MKRRPTRIRLLDGDVLFPPNMAFAMRLLSRIGAFDEHPSLATAGEDNEWAHRAMRAGVTIVYDPTIVVGHLARHSVRGSARSLPPLCSRAGGVLRYMAPARGSHSSPVACGTRFGARPVVAVARNRDAAIVNWCGWVEERSPGCCRDIVAGLRNRGVRT